MCANTCTHSQAGGEVDRGRVLPCQLFVTPSAVTQTHSSGDSQRTSSALTDTFQHWHAVRKPTWSLSLPPYVLEANCPRWSGTWKQNNFYLFQMWHKSCPHSFSPPLSPMNVSSLCFCWTEIVFSGSLLAVQNDRLTLNPQFSFRFSDRGSLCNPNNTAPILFSWQELDIALKKIRFLSCGIASWWKNNVRDVL